MTATTTKANAVNMFFFFISIISPDTLPEFDNVSFGLLYIINTANYELFKGVLSEQKPAAS